MSKVKFLSTIVVLVLMLLSTGSVFADDEEEEPALDLGIYSFTDQRLPGMTGADWQAFLFEMDGGNWGGGGSGGSGAAGLKEKYCKLVETLGNTMQGALAGAPITGTASTGLSLGTVFEGFVGITIDAAYRDIDHYNRNGLRPGVPFGSLINWQQKSINWPLNSWSGPGGGERPTSANGGLEHIFATWVLSVGLGNGTSELADPDPSTACP